MGFASDLGYEHRTPNTLQRGMQAFGASAVGATMFKLTLAHIDDVVARMSKGQQSVPGVLAGLPVLDIVTTGRRSGEPRRTHLIAVPYEETLALIGSNFGSATTPAWVFNLEANPRLTVSYREATIDALARPATDEEAAVVLDRSESIYPGYRRYQRRITDRRLRIFILQQR